MHTNYSPRAGGIFDGPTGGILGNTDAFVEAAGGLGAAATAHSDSARATASLASLSRQIAMTYLGGGEIPESVARAYDAYGIPGVPGFGFANWRQTLQQLVASGQTQGIDPQKLELAMRIAGIQAPGGGATAAGMLGGMGKFLLPAGAAAAAYFLLPEKYKRIGAAAVGAGAFWFTNRQAA